MFDWRGDKMLETIVYVENNLSYENYYSFRESVGWKNFSKQQAQDALQHTYYSIVAMAGEEAIFMSGWVFRKFLMNFAGWECERRFIRNKISSCIPKTSVL